MKIDGKVAGQLSKIVECDDCYWMTEDGKIYNQAGHGFIFQFAPNESGTQNQLIDLMYGVQKLQYPLSDLLRSAKYEAGFWDTAVETVSPKRWLIGIFYKNGEIDLYDRHIYTDETALKSAMQSCVTDYEGCTIVQLELGDTLKLEFTPKFIWEKKS